MKNTKFSAIVLCSCLLAACGGGGGGGGTTSVATNVDAQGYWTGPTNSGYSVYLAVLENGESWGIYRSGSLIYGAVYGASTVNGGTITITGTNFDFQASTATAGTLSGPVVAKNTMNLSEIGSSLTASLTYDPTYDTPATSSVIAGTWSTTGRSASYSLIPATITIDGTGNFSLVQPNCTSIGTVVPRPGGKNIYNVNLSTTGSGCASGQSTLSGVLFVDTTVTPYQFVALTLTPSKNDGLIVLGSKQ